MTNSFEFPGFHLPGSPVFNGASGSTMFAGELHSLQAVLDLAMVFGCRLWGHDQPTIDPMDLGAPGVGDLFTHDSRERACAALCERVAREGDLFARVLEGGQSLGTAMRALR